VFFVKRAQAVAPPGVDSGRFCCCAIECAQLETSRIKAYIYYYEYKTSDPRAGQKGGGFNNVLVDAIHLE